MQIPLKSGNFANVMTLDEKKEYIENGLKYAINSSEFGVADLSLVTRFCARVQINQDEVQQYVALLAAAGVVKTNVVGRSFYIIPTQNI